MKRTALVLSLLVAIFIFQNPVLAEDVINIGFCDPLTGPAAAVGIDALHGSLIAAKEINDEGGVMVAGKKYKVTSRAMMIKGWPPRP